MKCSSLWAMVHLPQFDTYKAKELLKWLTDSTMERFISCTCSAVIGTLIKEFLNKSPFRSWMAKSKLLTAMNTLQYLFPLVFVPCWRWLSWHWGVSYSGQRCTNLLFSNVTRMCWYMIPLPLGFEVKYLKLKCKNRKNKYPFGPTSNVEQQFQSRVWLQTQELTNYDPGSFVEWGKRSVWLWFSNFTGTGRQQERLKIAAVCCLCASVS